MTPTIARVAARDLLADLAGGDDLPRRDPCRCCRGRRRSRPARAGLRRAAWRPRRRRRPGRSWGRPCRRAGSRGRRGCRSVWWIAGTPLSSIPAKACEAPAARTASTATWTSPSVRFLKPIGIERPEPSWRWIWLSVVRAPIAPQATASEMYCGVIGSRNSQPIGSPVSRIWSSSVARQPQAGVDVGGAVEVRVVDQALPADRGPRLLEVDPHHDQQVLAELARRLRRAVRRSRAPPRRRGRCMGRRRPSAGRRRRRARRRPRRGRGPRRARARSPSGSSPSRLAGETSSTILSIRWSRTRSSAAFSVPIIIFPSPSFKASRLPKHAARVRHAAPDRSAYLVAGPLDRGAPPGRTPS